MTNTFDSGAVRKVYQKYNKECFVIYPNLIIADVSKSTIRGPTNQIQFSKYVNWNLEQYDI